MCLPPSKMAAGSLAAALSATIWSVAVTVASGATFPQCDGSFDPLGVPGVFTQQLATYHEEYVPFASLVVNCDDMDLVTLGEGDDLVAAVHTGQYGGGVRCGSCALVEGPRGSVAVTLIDRCECHGPGSHLDLSPRAFRLINNDDLDAGKIPISWRTVSCDGNGGRRLHYRFKDGSTEFWIQLQVVYSVDPIGRVDVWVGDRYWPMAMQPHGYWAFVDAPPPLVLPLAVRLTSTAGQVLHDELSWISYSQSDLLPGEKQVQFTPACPVGVDGAADARSSSSSSASAASFGRPAARSAVPLRTALSASLLLLRGFARR